MKVLVTGAMGFGAGHSAPPRQARPCCHQPFAAFPSGTFGPWGSPSPGCVTDPAAVEIAIRDQNAVIHTAAKTGVWGPSTQYELTNIEGTRSILRACNRFKVDRLIYTSSPSVIFDGNHAPNLSEEQASYPNTYLTHYSRTKAVAERRCFWPMARGSGRLLLDLT